MVLLRPCYIKDGGGRWIAADTPSWRSVQLELDEQKGEPLWNVMVRTGRFREERYKHFKIRDTVEKGRKPRKRVNVPKDGESSSSCPQNPVRSPPGITFTSARRYVESSDSEGSDDDDDDEWTPYIKVAFIDSFFYMESRFKPENVDSWHY